MEENQNNEVDIVENVQEEAPEPVNSDPVDQIASNEDTDHQYQSEDNDDDTSVDWSDEEIRNTRIAAIRKRASEKARDQVIKELEAQAQQAQQMQQNHMYQNQQAPTGQQQTIAPEIQQHLNNFNAYGEATFNDWGEAIAKISREASINPAIQDVAVVATQLPQGHKILHQLAQDTSKLHALAETRPELLSQKLIKMSIESDGNSSNKLVPRKPLNELKTTSNAHSGTEKSFAQKEKEAAMRSRV